MRRALGIVAAVAALAACMGGPAQAARYTHETRSTLWLRSTFTDGTIVVRFDADQRERAFGSGPPPAVTPERSSVFWMSVENKATGVRHVASGPAPVVIDPTLSGAKATWTMSNSSGTFTFDVTAVGTGSPEWSTETSGPPNPAATLRVDRPATLVG
ncbi:MAG TPA: hypothetical protein VM840_03670, partial [Actinomycetota bacterium]|nr:hypothetical protein [Actinomycetota bacterium]